MRGLSCFLVLITPAIAGAQQEVWLRPPVPPGLTQETLPQQPKPSLGSPRDRIDARAPEDREASTILTRTKAHIEQNEWTSAIQQLQGILNQPEDRLVRLGPGRFSSMRSEANRLLMKMPSEWRKRYRQQFGAAAASSFKTALSTGDYPAIGDVATRYLHTDAGQQAAMALALRHFDRGEHSMALRWFETLKSVGRGLSEVEQVRLAMAQQLLGIATDETPETIDSNRGELPARSAIAAISSAPSLGRTVSDWPQFMGTSDRQGRTNERFPVMVDSWAQPILRHDVAIEPVNDILEQLFDGVEGVIPAAVPIVVGRKVACRTLEGVEVFDTETGKRLWRTRAESSTQELRSSSPTRSAYYQVQAISQLEDRLRRFLFRDSVHGLLSSDGQRLFVIEDQLLPNANVMRTAFRSTRNPMPAGFATNVLTAYDLESGRVEWSIGGPDSTETFKPVLAGCYFHGVPVVHDENLYVIAEKNGAIRLHALDATTGEETWNQLLAYAESPIERDFVRRHWSAPITVAGGVLLCQTTVDWFVAVDPLTRGILWAHRVRPPAMSLSSTSRPSLRSLPALASRWSASAPVVIGNQVIYTPLEVANLTAIDIGTGRRKWSRSKGGQRYLAGANNGNAIVVGLNEVLALNTATRGQTKWRYSFESDHPAGRGILSKTHLHQPMASGEILSINLATGELSQRTGGANRNTRLVGNLVMHDDGVILQTPTAIEAYELRPDKNANQPQTPSDKLRAAELLLADSKVNDAIQAVDAIDIEALTKSDQARYTNLLERALTIRVREQPASALEDIERLSKVVDKAELITRLQIEVQWQSGNYTDAFRQLIVLFKSNKGQALSEHRSEVDRDTWLAGRLLDAWNKMEPATREELNRDVTELASSTNDKQRFAHVFSFHPLAKEQLNLELKELLNANELANAGRTLRSLARFKGDQYSESVFDVANALAKNGQIAEAEELLLQNGLDERSGDLPSSQTAAVSDEWTSGKWEVTQLMPARRSGAPVGIDAYAPKSDFLRKHALFGSTQGSVRLLVYSLSDGKLAWTIPLGGSQAITSVVPIGSALLVQHGANATCIDPAKRSVLWHKNLPGTSSSIRRVFQALRSISSPTRPTNVSGRVTPIAIANEDYVCIRGQRSIAVYDSVSGKQRWSRDDVAATGLVLGTRDAVFVKDSNGLRRAFRATDGTLLEAVTWKRESAVYGVVGSGFVLVESRGVLFRKNKVRLQNPITGENVWSLNVTRKARIAFVSDKEAILSDDDKPLSILNLTSGEVTPLDFNDDLGEGNVVVSATPDRIVVGRLKEGSETLLRAASQNVDRSLMVFAKDTGSMLWKRELDKRVDIVLSHFRTLPLIMLATNEQKITEDRGKMWDYELLDAMTGNVVAARTISATYDQGHRPMRLDLQRKFLEVNSANRRFRFSVQGAADGDRSSHQEKEPDPE